MTNERVQCTQYKYKYKYKYTYRSLIYEYTILRYKYTVLQYKYGTRGTTDPPHQISFYGGVHSDKKQGARFYLRFEKGRSMPPGLPTVGTCSYSFHPPVRTQNGPARPIRLAEKKV